MLTCEDHCGALEVLGHLDDAHLEYSIIGVDRRVTHLEYLLTIPYGIPVARFLFGMLDWLTGELEWRINVLAFLKRIAPLILSESVTPSYLRESTQFKPPPLEERPSVELTGPPGGARTTRRLVPSSAYPDLTIAA